MSTPRIDRLCADFLKRVPDEFQSEFTPGTGQTMPKGHLLKAEVILDYVNRALQELFNNVWQSVNGNIDAFTSIMPEMVKFSDAVPLSSGNYTIADPYKDFYKLIGAVKSPGNDYIKVKPESKYTLYLSEEYSTVYTPTEDEPAIIQVNQLLAVFPQTLTGNIKFHYIKVPVKPSTGGYLEQNGSYDSPFFEHWHSAIVDIAYLKYLKETNDTT